MLQNKESELRLDSPSITRRDFGTLAIAATGFLAPKAAQAQDTRYIPSSCPVTTLWTDPRVIRVSNVATGESGEFVYWRDGEFQMEAYDALSVLLRDHREQKAVRMHQTAFDAMYATQRWYEVVTGRKTRTNAHSGYRTWRSNTIVHGDDGSKHPYGWAVDGSLGGIPLHTYAGMLVDLRLGGVGLYAKHVHLDAGSIRFWRG